MSRTHTPLSLSVLAQVGQSVETCSVQDVLNEKHPGSTRKILYDTVFRLIQQGLLEYANPAKTQLMLTEDGRALLTARFPERDGIWKMVIFDIPEKQRAIRTFLRNKLKALGFKKWQASIWVSPYKLDAKLEEELHQLASKLFIRLIKTTDINYTKDLEELFESK